MLCKTFDRKLVEKSAVWVDDNSCNEQFPKDTCILRIPAQDMSSAAQKADVLVAAYGSNNLRRPQAIGLLLAIAAGTMMEELLNMESILKHEDLLADARFQQLVARLRELRHEVQTSRGIARVVWALGKISAKGADVSSILLHVANVAPGKLSSFSSQEISSMLWGLAKLSEGRRLPEPLSRPVTALIS